MKEGSPYTNEFNQMHSYQEAHFVESYGKILADLKLSSESRVLEFGSGAGDEAEFIRKSTGAQVVELDISQDAYLAYPLPERNFIVADYRALPYAENSFSFIHSKDVLVHIKDKDRMFAEFKRVLKPGGLLLLTTEIASGLTGGLGVKAERVARKLNLHPDARYYFPETRKKLEILAKEAGFKLKRSFAWDPGREKNWYDKKREVFLFEAI